MHHLLTPPKVAQVAAPAMRTDRCGLDGRIDMVVVLVLMLGRDRVCWHVEDVRRHYRPRS